MKQKPIKRRPIPGRRALWTHALLALLGLSALLSGCGAQAQAPVPTGTPAPTTQPDPTPITEQALEETYGIHINLVAVIAAGGMVDVRFRVLDKDKAALLLDKPKPRLAVVAEADGTMIQAPDDVVQHFELETDQVYFVQFPNPQHVVESGGYISLILDQVRVEHVLVQ